MYHGISGEVIEQFVSFGPLLLWGSWGSNSGYQTSRQVSSTAPSHQSSNVSKFIINFSHIYIYNANK